MADQVAEQKPPGGKELPSSNTQSGGVFRVVRDFLTFVGEVALLSWQALTTLLRGGVDMRDVIRQMASIGTDSVGIVLANNIATGIVFAMYTAMLALQIGLPDFVGGTLAYAFLNELGPMLSGVALASRCGAAIAAEIGSMVVTQQVDALRAMAVSPVRYLVIPRVLAGMLMLPLLTILADISGIFGASVSAVFNGVPYAVFWDSVYRFTQPVDMIRGLLKAVVFGFLVGIVACQQGLRTEGGATGVGRATTSSVVLCVVLIFISDIFLAQVLTQRILRN